MGSGTTGVRFIGLVHSSFSDFTVGGASRAFYANSNKFYDGIWFDCCELIKFEPTEISDCQNDGLIINGHSGTNPNPCSDFLLLGGKIGGCGNYGVHIAGRFGGFQNSGCDVLNNGVNTAITCKKVPYGNTQIDLNGADDTSVTGANILIDETGGSAFGGGYLAVRRWSCSAKTYGLHVKYAPSWVVQVSGATISSNTQGGIQVDDATAFVSVANNLFTNNGNWDVNPAVANHKVSVGWNNHVNNAIALNPAYGAGAGQKVLAAGYLLANEIYLKHVAFQPFGSGTDPYNNGDMLFDSVSNTELRVRQRGTDGVIRQASLPLSTTGALLAIDTGPQYEYNLTADATGNVLFAHGLTTVGDYQLKSAFAVEKGNSGEAVPMTFVGMDGSNVAFNATQGGLGGRAIRATLQFRRTSNPW